MGLRIMHEIEKQLKLLCDNNLVVQFLNNDRSLLKFKYIDIKYLVGKERTHNGQVTLENIGTDSD